MLFFQYARAAQYTGPGPALTPAKRAELMEFFNKVYQDFHGGVDGRDQVLVQANAAALPPANFSIESAVDRAKDDSERLQARIASDPPFALWFTIRQNLTGDQADTFFDKTVKGTLVPGGAEGVHAFSGTVISVDSPDAPTKVLLGVEDPAKADATLEFSKPLPPVALDKIKPDQKIQFSGVVTKYAKDPYMLIFGEPTILGLQTIAPDNKTAPRRK